MGSSRADLIKKIREQAEATRDECYAPLFENLVGSIAKLDAYQPKSDESAAAELALTRRQDRAESRKGLVASTAAAVVAALALGIVIPENLPWSAVLAAGVFFMFRLAIFNHRPESFLREIELTQRSDEDILGFIEREDPENPQAVRDYVIAAVRDRRPIRNEEFEIIEQVAHLLREAHRQRSAARRLRQVAAGTGRPIDHTVH